MKLKEIIEIKAALDYIAGKEGYSMKLSYAAAKNLKKIMPLLTEFDADKKLMVDKLAVKDDKGEPIIKNGNYNFGDNKQLAEDEHSVLLDKDYVVDFYKIKPEVDDKIPGSIIFPLLDIIEE